MIKEKKRKKIEKRQKRRGEKQSGGKIQSKAGKFVGGVAAVSR